MLVALIVLDSKLYDSFLPFCCCAGLVGPGQAQPQQFNGFPGFGGGLLSPQLTGMDMSQLGNSMHSSMPGLTVDNNSRLSSLTTNESSASSPPVYR